MEMMKNVKKERESKEADTKRGERWKIGLRMKVSTYMLKQLNPFVK